MAIYEVREGDKSRLIEALTDGKVALHVLQPTVVISIPSKKRLTDLMRAGVPIEDINKKPSA